MEKFKNKVWYRAVTVIFVVTFIIFQLYIIKIIYNNFPPLYSKTIVCDNGSSTEYKTAYKDKEYVPVGRWNIKKSGLDGCVSNTLSYESFLKNKNNQEGILDVVSIFKLVLFMMIGIVLNIILFWLIKKIFFYVANGEKIIKINKK